MKIQEMFPEDIYEAPIGDKFYGSGKKKIERASLSFCRYNNGAIYILKNRNSHIGYVTEETLEKMIIKTVSDIFNSRGWKCNFDFAILLIDERKVD